MGKRSPDDRRLFGCPTATATGCWRASLLQGLLLASAGLVATLSVIMLVQGIIDLGSPAAVLS